MITYRPYQKEIINKGTKVIKKYGFVYLMMEVRTGKTLTSLGIADNVALKHVLFITKKKAISSIEQDVAALPRKYTTTVINYESIHKIPNHTYDLIICDEAHSMGAFPKPSKRAKDVAALIRKCDAKVILLSGTPSPESYSQLYHQVYGIPKNPFRMYKNFYRFADCHVNKKQRKLSGLLVNDYSHGLESIKTKLQPMSISYTQREAGFKTSVEEEVLTVEMKPIVYSIVERLKKDFVVEGKDEYILADTPVKLMSKVHQLCSGTVKFESGNSMVIDTTKAEFIKDTFKGKKLGIFYKFKEELKALKSVFGDTLTTDLEEFNCTDKHIALQIVSGREGISLRKADYIIYYNIDFSATSYWQSRDRMTTKDSTHNKVYWIFSKNGIEHSIYKAVAKKKDYTLKHFKKDILSL